MVSPINITWISLRGNNITSFIAVLLCFLNCKTGDSVILWLYKTSLFKEKRYLIQLYRALHPEDTKTTEDDLKDVTVSNVLVDDIYNDLGFTVGTTIMLLIEVQST